MCSSNPYLLCKMIFLSSRPSNDIMRKINLNHAFSRGEENNHMRPQHPASFKPRRREEKSSQRVKEAVKRLYEVEDDEGKKSQGIVQDHKLLYLH